MACLHARMVCACPVLAETGAPIVAERADAKGNSPPNSGDVSAILHRTTLHWRCAAPIREPRRHITTHKETGS